jgi:hypothetical protein
MIKSPSRCIVYIINFCIILVFCLFISHASQAQLLSGYADNYLGINFNHAEEPIAFRSRFRLKPSFEFASSSRFFSDIDFRIYHGSRNDSIPITIREFYSDIYFPSVDIRIGKQIQRWGKTFSGASGNLFSQLTATDFVTNSPDELISGFWGANINWYLNDVSINLITSPIWAKPQIPRQNSPWFFAIPIDLPLPTTISFDDTSRVKSSFNGAIRIQFQASNNFDFDILGFHWFVNQPSYKKSFTLNLLDSRFNLNEIYKQSWGFGASMEWRISENQRIKSDFIYWNSRYVDWLPQRIRDVNFQNPTLQQLIRLVQVVQEESSISDGFIRERPWIQSVTAYSWDWNSWQFNHEILVEAILNYSKDIQQAQFFYSTSHSIVKQFKSDFTFLSSIMVQPLGWDAYWFSQFKYQVNDALATEVSVHLFLGNEPQLYYPYLNFAAFKENNFWAIRFIYSF